MKLYLSTLFFLVFFINNVYSQEFICEKELVNNNFQEVFKELSQEYRNLYESVYFDKMEFPKNLRQFSQAV